MFLWKTKSGPFDTRLVHSTWVGHLLPLHQTAISVFCFAARHDRARPSKSCVTAAHSCFHAGMGCRVFDVIAFIDEIGASNAPKGSYVTISFLQWTLRSTCMLSRIETINQSSACHPCWVLFHASWLRLGRVLALLPRKPRKPTYHPSIYDVTQTDF